MRKDRCLRVPRIADFKGIPAAETDLVVGSRHQQGRGVLLVFPSPDNLWVEGRVARIENPLGAFSWSKPSNARTIRS